MKINDNILKEQADLAIQNAPNSDWRGRGELTMVGDSRIVSVHKHSWGSQEMVIGNATVAFFRFQNPLQDNFFHPFVGFTIGVIRVGNKIVSETSPVISEIKDDDFGKPANDLAHRFCPQCGKLDSVKNRSRVVGPECVAITYYCKCGYKITDVID